MSIIASIKRLIARRDDAARERAAERAVESKEGRAETDAGVDGLAADEQAARSMGEGSIADVDRLGD